MHEEGAPLPPRSSEPRLSRRRFVAIAAVLPAAFWIACTRRDDRPAGVGPAPAASPKTSPSPAVGTAPDVSGQSLDDFLTISALLTGFDKQDLDPGLGRTYLASLQARPNPELKLTDFYTQIGFRSSAPPRSLQELADTGALGQDQPRTLANKIVEYWYTGIYDTGNGPAVATFREALAWKALGFAVAPTTCLGSPGVWAEQPRQTVA